MTRAFRLYTSERPQIRQTLKPLLGRYWFRRPFSDDGLRVLIIFHPNRIALTQVDPFFYHRADLKSHYGVDLRALSIEDFLVSDGSGPKDADIVLLQTWFDLEESGNSEVFSRLKKSHPRASIIYLDWFAPLDLRLAEHVNDKISLYVKKQIFRNIDLYKKPVLGSTNLEDYYGRLYRLSGEYQTHNIPDGFFDKVKLGPGFFTETEMTRRFMAPMPPAGRRTIDVNARMTCDGPGWYGKMRADALRAIAALRQRNVVTDFQVGRRAFRRELYTSKLCFSPFGYGEVCLRDFEAIMAGSALIKPDTSHLVTHPDIFRPFETYIPVDWKFSDVVEKAEYYLTHEHEREQIAQNAYRIIHQYVAEKRFIAFAGDLLSCRQPRAGLDPTLAPSAGGT